ncbi:MAG: hypothetical protein ACK5KL_04175 [Dysgonomonas sp.]|nr:hypothetical protein [Prevotella sp.]
MNTLMIIIILLASVVASLYWGIVLSVKLPLWDRRFNRKPFNCRPCLTFHLIATSGSLFALLLLSVELFLAGIATAFTVFFIVRYIDNKKVIK